MASDAGLKDLPDVPSLALGVGLVTPLSLTTAYTMFPEGGEVVEPRGILDVLDADGTSVFAPSIERRRVVSDAVAFQTLSMLRDVIDRGTANGARAAGVAGPVGGKTGTTDDYHDAWFVGFSSSVVAGVWVGFDQPKPIGANAVRRPRRAPDLGRLHETRGRRASPRGVHRSGDRLTASRSAACRTCGRWTAAPFTPSTSRKATTDRLSSAPCTAVR